MFFERSYNLATDEGAQILVDLECRIEATLDWLGGEPIVSIDDVQIFDYRSTWQKPEYVSLLHSKDAMFQSLGARIAGMAEDDASILDALMDGDEVSYHGLGGNDPDGYYAIGAQRVRAW